MKFLIFLFLLSMSTNIFTQKEISSKAKNYFGTSLNYYHKGLEKKALKFSIKAHKIQKDPRYLMLKLILEYKEGKKIDKKTTKQCFEKLKKNRDSFSYYCIGFCYQKGLMGKNSPSKALKWYRKSAKLKNTLAMNAIALICNENLEKYQALEWYRKSAKLGNTLAMIEIGNIYGSGTLGKREEKVRFEWHEKAAKLGDVRALISLGIIYELGLGVEKNYEQAMKLYLEASKFGFTEGMRRIGRMYYKEIGVKRNYPKAFFWYLKAANTGCWLSMSNIGDMYYKGLGVEKNYHKAFEWYEKSAYAGNDWAWKKLGDMCLSGNIGINYEKANYYYEKYEEFIKNN